MQDHVAPSPLFPTYLIFVGSFIDMWVVLSAVSEASPLDDRGRITIRREYRDRLGERVVQILTPHGVLLRPVPDEIEGTGALPEALTASGEQDALEEAGR